MLVVDIGIMRMCVAHGAMNMEMLVGLATVPGEIMRVSMVHVVDV